MCPLAKSDHVGYDVCRPTPPIPGDSPMPYNPSRRTFLRTAAASAGTLAFGVPAVNALGANDRLSIGVIGYGNRGRTISGEAIKNGCRLVAVADAAKFRLGAVK